MAVLAVLAAGVASETRGEARFARNRIETARARALADAGTALAIARLLDPDPVQHEAATGTPRKIDYGGGVIVVAVQDEGGKIDLNYAPLTLLDGLFTRLGLAEGDRAALLDGIAARRKAYFGASAEATPVVPVGISRSMFRFDAAKLPFAASAELRALPGVSDAAYRQIAPFVTVYAQSPRINPMTAPRTVLMAIPGAAGGAVEAFLQARATAGPPSGVSTAASGAIANFGDLAAVAELAAAAITAAATTASGASFVRDSVVELTPDTPLHPYRTLRWAQGAR